MTRPLTGSLRIKIIAWVFVPTAIILLAVALVNFYSYQDVTEDLVIERDRDLTQLWAEQLATKLESFPRLLSEVSRTPGISRQNDAGVQAALVNASPQLRVFDAGVLILDTFGTVTAIHPYRPDIVGQDWSDRTHFRQMLRSPGPVFSDVLYDGPQGTEVIEIAVPISGDQGEFLGSMIGMFSLRATSISAFYGGILSLRIGNGRSYIVDGNGKVLYHDDPNQVGADFGTQQPVTQVLLGEVGAIRTQDLEGTDILSAFARVPGTSWGLVTEESWSALTGGNRDYQRFLLLLLALGVAVPAVFVAIGLKRVMRPIEQLTRAAKEVAQGNFGQTIAVHSGDEIEELATEFNMMAGQLKDSYEELEQRVVERTEELAESEEQYRTLFENSSDAIFMTKQGKMLAINQAGLDLFGFSLEEAIGSDTADRFVDPTDQTRFREEMTRLGSLREFEVKLRKQDGTVMDCLVTASRRVAGDESDSAEVQGIVRDITERKQAAEAALQQTREVAVLEERNRMAREIHDTMAQGFTGIVLQLEAAEQTMDESPGPIGHHLGRAKGLAREGLQEARRSVWGLLPHALEQTPLDDALEGEVKRFDADGPVKSAFTSLGKRRDLPTEVQTVLFRICQESLANVNRHAEATEVKVNLKYDSGEVRLSVQDNGVGFDPDEVQNGDRRSFGLTSMEQRAHGLEGILSIKSGKDQGTLVEVVIPTP